MTNLKSTVIGGVFWSALGQGGAQLLQFLTTLVLARILNPDDFGVVAMATTFTMLAGTVNQFGISPAIIHRQDLTEDHLNSAFWANVTVGILLCLLTILGAGAIADFYQNELVRPILYCLSLVFPVGALRIVNNALLTKALKFKIVGLVTIVEMASNAVVAISLAFYDFGVWSIVYGRIAGLIVGVLLVFIVSPWRPRFMFKMNKLKELLSFGVSAMGSSIVSYFIISLDNIIVGRYLGAMSLGMYSMAYNIVTLPQKRISSVVSKVAFPAFARIQENKTRVAEGYIKIIQMLSFITFPILGGLFAVAPEFVSVILGEKWLASILPLRILCLAGMVRAIVTTVGSVFFSQGRPDLELRLDCLSLILLFFALLIGKNWGLQGVAVAICLQYFFMQFFFFSAIAKLLKKKKWAFYKPVVYNLFLSSVMVVVVLLIAWGLEVASIGAVGQLICCIVSGVAIYLVIAYLFNRKLLFEIVDIVKFRKSNV